MHSWSWCTLVCSAEVECTLRSRRGTTSLYRHCLLALQIHFRGRAGCVQQCETTTSPSAKRFSIFREGKHMTNKWSHVLFFFWQVWCFAHEAMRLTFFNMSYVVTLKSTVHTSSLFWAAGKYVVEQYGWLPKNCPHPLFRYKYIYLSIKTTQCQWMKMQW